MFCGSSRPDQTTTTRFEVTEAACLSWTPRYLLLGWLVLLLVVVVPAAAVFGTVSVLCLGIMQHSTYYVGLAKACRVTVDSEDTPGGDAPGVGLTVLLKRVVMVLAIMCVVLHG